MKSILLFFDGVLKTQSAHVHSFLLLVISNSKLLINLRVDSFFLAFKFVKGNEEYLFVFFSFAFYLPILT